MTAFVDTNVLLYLLASDTRKADIAEALLSAAPVVSVQVMNELVAVTRRKLRFSWAEVAELTNTVRALCTIQPLTLELHDEARRLAERYQLAWYDALIVAAAVAAGCNTLYSEDMQHGQRIDLRLTIRNPFH